jgi:2-C-methyl-D-erythritol 4-phosphate cytidylyltransferase
LDWKKRATWKTMEVVALIPAAGKGKRMGGSMEKQFFLLDGKSILAHTLSPFEASSRVDRIIIIAPAQSISHCWKKIVRPFEYKKVSQIIKGGQYRQDSVRMGLEAIEGSCDLVMIHDGARPFVTIDIIERAIDATEIHSATVAAVPAQDTIKAVQGGVVSKTFSRGALWQIQTPQTFSYDLILRAHREALKDGYLGTDDASLVERLGHPVKVLMGSHRNLKVTTPEDLHIAKAMLSVDPTCYGIAK